MNSQSKHIVRRALLMGVLAGLTGCIVVKINVNSPKPEDHAQKPVARGSASHSAPIVEDPWPPEGSYTETFNPKDPLGPSGNSGSLNVPISSSYGNGGAQTCFPTSQGWNKYFPLPRYFLGPGVTPDAQSYTNVDQLTNCTVRTCDPANGTTLQTGIVIYEQFNPSTDKRCATNSPSCLVSSNLTIDQRPLESGKKYRATVFFNSLTLGQLTNVTVQWSYP